MSNPRKYPPPLGKGVFFDVSNKHNAEDSAREAGAKLPAKTWRERVGPYVRKVAPATKVMEKVAQLAVQIQKPSVLGVAGMVSAGLNALNELCCEGPTAGCRIELLVSPGQIAKAFEKAGAVITTEPFHGPNGASETIYATIHERMYTIQENSQLFYFGEPPDEKFYEWLTQILDAVLPASIEVREVAGKDGGAKVSTPLKLAKHSTRQGKNVLEATLPLLGSVSRCILLEGKPGVGKTTMAQQIAREAGLGRTVLLHSGIVGLPRDGNNNGVQMTGSGSYGGLFEAVAMLRPGVVIVDDIDKIHFSLHALENLRRAAKLVVLTANNGDYDDVLDGSFLRAGRVDEVFVIEPEHVERRAPFDLLNDEDWSTVQHWPIAYLNEVEHRLLHRPHNLRLDDLKNRITKKVRSGDKLYGDVPSLASSKAR